MSLFDQSTIIEQVKTPMSPADKARGVDITRSLALCLDDLSSRLFDKGLATSRTISSVAAGTRTLKLDGNNEDLKYIFAVKYGADKEIVEYRDALFFLKNHDSPTATAGSPGIFTVLVSDEGFPVIKFDKPTESTADILVYFFPYITADNVVLARNAASAMVLGTQALFYGIGDGKGMTLWAEYKEAVKLARATNHPAVNTNSAFVPNVLDRNTSVRRWNERFKRA